jgi:hypothetical protein
MSEGGINFLKTGKWGRVGYEVGQQFDKCADVGEKKRGSISALPKKGAVTQRLSKTRVAPLRLL